MSTAAERKALLFLGIVACLGAGVRTMRAHQLPPPPADARRALDARISAVAGPAAPRGRSGGGGGHANGVPKSGVDTNPPVRARRKPVTVKPQVTVVAPVAPPGPLRRVDVDRATANELQALPGIGPALAARIVAFRDSNGPFGSMTRLQQVKGIGPATAKRLDSLVTFSGIPRL
ncbi:MAG: ComEA family DNA-binding protein [Gemmatimonadaceae bacterium]